MKWHVVTIDRSAPNAEQQRTYYEENGYDKIEEQRGIWKYAAPKAHSVQAYDVAEHPKDPDDAPEDESVTRGAHKGGGWYYALQGGERLIEDGEPLLVGPGKDKAAEQVRALNEQ